MSSLHASPDPEPLFEARSLYGFAGHLPAPFLTTGAGEIALAEPDTRVSDSVSRLAAFLKAQRLGLLLAGGFLALLLVATLAPGLLTRIDPLAADSRAAFLPPGVEHWLGTDENGRDQYARLVHGTASSLGLGIMAMAISLGLGIVVGLIGGLGGRIADEASMRFADTMAAIPSVLFALLVITLWGANAVTVMVAIGVTTMPRYARLVRVEALKLRRAPFVEAATTLGLHRVAVVWRHILPNAVKPALLLSVIGIGDKIALAATLSFLGFGSPPPTPEWGAMLATSRNFVPFAPWLLVAPAVLITLTVLATTAVGREIIRRGEGRQA